MNKKLSKLKGCFDDADVDDDEEEKELKTHMITNEEL
jgi:hypothetical protein